MFFDLPEYFSTFERFSSNTSPLLKSLLLTLSFLFILQSAVAQFNGGSGTESDPYLVSTAIELDSVRHYLDAYFIQTANIDLSVSYSDDTGWQPIGTSSSPFSGEYDGQGYSIDGLFIELGTSTDVGLFGQTSYSASLSDIHLINVDVTGNESTGGLVGYNESTITKCSVSGSVTGNDLNTGGLIGYNKSRIYESFSDVTVDGESRTGGLVGISATDNTVIEQSFVRGDVTGSTFVGGLIGSNYGEIIDSYTHASVTGDAYVASFSGGNYYAIIRSFATGPVTVLNSSLEAFGIAAYDDGDATVTNSYWDINTTGVTSESLGGTPLTTSEMYQAASYTNFDFTTVWSIDEGNDYPKLRVFDDNAAVNTQNDSGLPSRFQLNQNYPNPFNPVTTIRYSVPESGNVKLEIYNMIGQKISTLVDYNHTPGDYSVRFDAGALSSGIYLYRLSMPGKNVLTKKMTLLK